MPRGARADRNLALVVAGTFFMENLDGTIVVTAAPAIGSSLGVSCSPSEPRSAPTC